MFREDPCRLAEPSGSGSEVTIHGTLMPLLSGYPIVNSSVIPENIKYVLKFFSSCITKMLRKIAAGKPNSAFPTMIERS